MPKKKEIDYDRTVLAVVKDAIADHGLTATAVREAYLLGAVDGIHDHNLADYALKELTKEQK
jgi:hypothetical protein